ncbi:hypothetical protein A6A08_06965 [Nocardiopsis sp. TSRI0078]|uniref:hypothetical protein n=1 Tax=unclassified Nocardiopsis TaxID=2649073 RepID=UPI00093FD423|nr:hypothetical protein [Nocardiopsis sp. TSRI0078]OKI17002.1 hypothetical protein A6A08_06965 [Nocardiopsis sp. TSRI0078]
MPPSYPADETVLPRPVAPLPLPPIATARHRLADKLREHFDLSEEGADAFALAVTDPAQARKAIEVPERLPVPGGVILAIRTHVWARHIMPDPRNPRISPARRHAASGLIGRGEATRERPLPEPVRAPRGRPELVQRVRSKEHLAWSAKQASDYVLNSNDWRDSIRNQGVMTEVWLVATTITHDDDTPDVTVPTTAEGSSRITCVHRLLPDHQSDGREPLRSADVPYQRNDRRLRAEIRRLNEAISSVEEEHELEEEVAVQARCEIVPALLLVGFEPHSGTTDDFGVAVKSLVALRHVDYPKPWGPAAENETLADAVIDELRRQNLITAKRADWLSGGLTPQEAKEAGFSDDPATRAAAIVRTFTDRDPEVHAAVRTAITSQSTRKRTSGKLLFELATSLILRSLPEEEPRRRERIRKYLSNAFRGDLAKEDWAATYRSPEDLVAAALSESEEGRPGPASAELAVRSAYSLIVKGALTADRGTQNNDQPDRRNPSEVIDRMRATPRGIHQLGQALLDLSRRGPIRLVDEHGEVERTEKGTESRATEQVLRTRFYAEGKGPGMTPAPQTPAENLGNALTELAAAVEALLDAVGKVERVKDDDGTPAIASLGADPGDCANWQGSLFGVIQKLPLWQQRKQALTSAAYEEEDPEADGFDDPDLDEGPVELTGA